MVAIESHIRLTRWLKSFSRWDGWLVACGGGMVLLGWLSGNEMLKRVSPGLVAMNPVTALGFVFAGISLACYWLAESKPTPQWLCGRVLAGVLISLGTLKLAQYLFGWRFAFDQFLFQTQLQRDQGITNQIAPNTAFNLAVSGVALWLLNSPTHRFSRGAQNLSLALAFISLVPLVGYMYRVSYLYSIGSYIPMALHTAGLFFLLACGMLLAQPNFGIIALFTSKTPGGAIARRLLPFAFGVPIVLGALTVWSQKEQIYPGEFGITIIVVAFIAVFTEVIWWNAVLLNRADFQRREAEAKLQNEHDQLEIRVQERTAALDDLNKTLLKQIDDLKKAEEKIREQAEQLLRTQRMESIGTLAGGIAHDLNNALAPIILATQLLKDEPNETDRKKFLNMISGSADRSVAMVRQILSFARGSKSPTGQIQIGQLINEMVKLVQDTFPKSILINANMPGELWNVSGDATELHQVLLNLCVNARDAMPNGGEITFQAQNVTLNQEIHCLPANIPSGAYMVLSITDTGTGIPPEILPRIFEPFFTTKTPDKGTGLGLSTVVSIIKKHDGFIQIQSEIGKGTNFKIYLPALQLGGKRSCEERATALPAGHGELVMVMDDEQTVRELAKTTLENYGYRVLTAMSGLDGITTFGEYKQEIKLLISDTDMPFTNGMSVIRSIQKLKPELPIIIASGSKLVTERFQGIDKIRLTILNKPYSVEQLLSASADALNLNSGKVSSVIPTK